MFISILKILIWLCVCWWAYILYDRIEWYFTCRRNAINGVKTIAGYLTELRELLYLTYDDNFSEGSRELDDVLKKLQIENLRSAYIIGGVHLQKEVLEIAETDLPKGEQ